MASLLEVFPRKIIALVAVPLLLGLSLLAFIFQLDATAWALILLVVLMGLAVVGLLVVRLMALEKEEEFVAEVE